MWLVLLILFDALLVAGILALLGVTGIYRGIGHDHAFHAARRYVLTHAPHRAHRTTV